MNALSELFPDSAAIDGSAPEDRRTDFAAIPAKPAVYLLTGKEGAAGEQPILLATVGDLRGALKRRLADTPADIKSRRIAYASLCTRVHFRRVDSAFAANYWYDRAAHTLFPETAAGLIPWRDSWWIAVEKSGDFPRFRKTTKLSDPALAYAGPIRDKHAAQRLIEGLEDLFDLCRYHNILVQAPCGRACAYKEMGKCPAPCDGTISLAEYHRQIDSALAFVAHHHRGRWQTELESQMKSAAAAQHFEEAARIRRRLTRAARMQNEALAHLGLLEDFAFLTLQPGKGKPWIEPWLIMQGRIECLPQVQSKEFPAAAESLAALCRERLASPLPSFADLPQVGRIALIAHHLFKGQNDHGLWLRARQIVADGSPPILEAMQHLRARKTVRPMSEQSSDTLPSELAQNANNDANGAGDDQSAQSG